MKEFKCGNSATLPATEEAATLVCNCDSCSGKRTYGFIRAAIVKGAAPLLISKKFLEDMDSKLSARSGILELAAVSVEVQLNTSARGRHWMIKLDD